ncbi:MAG: hypothetical protein RJB53_1385 [Pseudomonadota bacterium]|jgi:16S rRNA (cytosine967-C5)-methyltransferase
MSRRQKPAKSLTRFDLLERLIAEVLQLSAPADSVISAFFRANKNLGMRDRAFYAETVWAVLRNRSWYTHLSAAGSGSMNRRFALLAVLDCFGPAGLAPDPARKIFPQVSDQEQAWLTHVESVRQTQIDPAVRESIPPWLYQEWVARLGPAEALACARAMNQTAPLDLRINTHLVKPAEVIDEFLSDQVSVTRFDFFPDALRIEGKPALHKTKPFLRGWVEVQDLGSQCLAKLVHAKRGQFIVDFCAGAGGKTLAIGAALKNTGRLYALDVSATRLARLKPRLARSGLSNVWPSAITGPTDDRVKRLHGKADAVLVDAPCSGLGTLRRNPDLKWRMTADRIGPLNEQQSEILLQASRLVKSGGLLVYGTCSPLPQENELIVERFLSEQPGFRRVSAQEILSAQRIDLPADWQAFTSAGDLMLWPHRTQTDGFYAAVLTRD